ncbi:ubiquitin C-terminal hydrolase [Pseudozyma hubeiensis SY62]|uniref:Ubiquitin C-terminal hydrolase n=1 Tax=Pseudozyma hubeiensis (strain SY62) TaxID=1305764 RepID=R9P600_PSEHS|nr:ubiquitin C-terminal hydrolase [Pseudozyma hubeiensis SY62]GAC96677.1 ubiquitin C-terminal hydrolase [Pseudozyma hubeiensis SY62]
MMHFERKEKSSGAARLSIRCELSRRTCRSAFCSSALQEDCIKTRKCADLFFFRCNHRQRKSMLEQASASFRQLLHEVRTREDAVRSDVEVMPKSK